LEIQLGPIHELVLLAEGAVEAIPYRFILFKGGLNLITLKDDLVNEESGVSFGSELL